MTPSGSEQQGQARSSCSAPGRALHAVSRPPVLRVSPAVCRRAPERPAHAPNARFRGINHLMRSRLLIAGAAAALAAAALGLGGILRGGGAPAVAPRPAAQGLASGFGAGDTAGLVRTLQAELRRYPRNAKDWGYLGLAYQQRARESGDPSWYTKSAGALHRALALN